MGTFPHQVTLSMKFLLALSSLLALTLPSGRVTTALLWWELLQPTSPVRSLLTTKLQSSWPRCVHKLRTLTSVWSSCPHSGPRLLVSSGLATTRRMLSGCVHRRDCVEQELGKSTAKSASKASRPQLTKCSPNHLSMEL